VDEGEEGEKKRKLGGGGGMKFKTAEERAMEEEEMEGGEMVRGAGGEVGQEVEEEVPAAKEAGIVVRDED
jgi:hypothetical protein